MPYKSKEKNREAQSKYRARNPHRSAYNNYRSRSKRAGNEPFDFETWMKNRIEYDKRKRNGNP